MTISECILQQQSQDLPFVIYRKPNTTQVLGFTQSNRSAHHPNDTSDAGFLFAPFSETHPTLLIPGTHPLTLGVDLSPSPEVTLDTLQSATERQRYIDLVDKAITTIKGTELQKIVLSRKQELPHQKSISQLLHDLLAVYPSAFVYCWYHPETGLWMGATPERLLSQKYQTITTMSLAGTKHYENTTAVTWGAKEREEQQLVTNSIVSRLTPWVEALEVGELHTHRAGKLLHLKTDIKATLLKDGASISDIITALHPTPAVCGLPREQAKEFIYHNEGYDRKYYTGYLGEFGVPQDLSRAGHRKNVENLAYMARGRHSNLFVNLRCMEVSKTTASVYVGGGITAASIAKNEWMETVHKLGTMSRVLA